MKKGLVAFFVLIVAGGCFTWNTLRTSPEDGTLRLFGNIDIRQVSLAFERGGRILEVLVEEGDRVEKGKTLARIDVRALELQAKKLEADIAGLEHNLNKMKNGSRPEEIAKAQASLRRAEATLVQAKRNDRRSAKLHERDSISLQERENAQTDLRIAQAQRDEAERTLALLQAGFRSEDIAMAAAQLDAARASLDVIRHDISLGVLYAPTEAVVSSRLLEPGDMASSASPVFQLSLTSPKWVRAYVSESQLGRVRHGMRASIHTDSFPDAVHGSVGYISPTAEFTPKSIQTEELRTALLYEIRIIADDRSDRLRLGMPVTVLLHEQANKP